MYTRWTFNETAEPGVRKELTMVTLVLLAFVVTLGLLTLRYGYDSRDRLYSPEEEFAAFGMTWAEELSDEQIRTDTGTMVAEQARVRLLAETA